MSAVSVYVLICDHVRCTRTFTSTDKRADDTRAAARAKGWTHAISPRASRSGPATSVDFCPEHGEMAKHAEAVAP